MSYFSIDTNKINEENNMMQMTHEIPKKRPPHSIPHTEEAKKRISETQQARYAMMRTLIGKTQQLSEARIKEICREVLNDYVDKNARPINNNNKRPTNINL